MLDGRVVMLGWRSIASGGVREGALRMWPDGEVDLGSSYYVTGARRQSGATQAFLACITSLESLALSPENRTV
ncbi:MAG: hypothetical protein ACU0AY_00910 [Marinibacterium profundimaris]